MFDTWLDTLLCFTTMGCSLLVCARVRTAGGAPQSARQQGGHREPVSLHPAAAGMWWLAQLSDTIWFTNSVGLVHKTIMDFKKKRFESAGLYVIFRAVTSISYLFMYHYTIIHKLHCQRHSQYHQKIPGDFASDALSRQFCSCAYSGAASAGCSRCTGRQAAARRPLWSSPRRSQCSWSAPQ